MKIKLLALSLYIVSALALNANAQTFPENNPKGVDFGMNDLKRGALRDRLRVMSDSMEEEKKPTVKLETDIEEVMFSENGKVLTKEEFEKQISAYATSLNLTFEQKSLAKKISDDARLKKEQLLRGLYLLQKQSRNLEEQSMREFMEILTPEQKQIFLKLRATENAKREAYDNLKAKIVTKDKNNETENEEEAKTETEDKSKAKTKKSAKESKIVSEHKAPVHRNIKEEPVSK